MLKKTRTLKDGREVTELEKVTELKIITKCPEKWSIIDNETGQMYNATGDSTLYKQWKPIYNEHNRDTKNDPFKGTNIEGKD
tara:strand:+ start:161 stop:406 length:246 start_codon:yes stop_codon:yes gene_type:complete